MILSKRVIWHEEKPKLVRETWPVEYWELTQSEKNKHKPSLLQVAEMQRMRRHLTPKELGSALNIGVWRVHQILNKYPVVIPIRVRKKGIHDISAKVQRKIDRSNRAAEYILANPQTDLAEIVRLFSKKHE
jgi:hypothetical protein